MKTITARIKHDACPYIDLTAAESDHYHGCGDALFATRGDEITAIQCFDQICLYGYDHNPSGMTEAMTSWAQKQEGEIWFGICSSHQICRPKKIDVESKEGSNVLLRTAYQIYEDD